MTVKEYLAKQKNTLISRRDQLNADMIDAETKEARAEIGAALATLRDEINEVEKQLADIDEPAQAGADDPANDEGRKSILGKQETRTSDEGTASLEYRRAFQKFLSTGKMEARADDATTTGDSGISTVIPENLVTQILETYEQLGTIYNLVTKTAFPVGQSIPVDSVKPSATWVGRNTTTLASSTTGEGLSSDSLGKTLGSLITFSHFKLRCEVRWTEEVATMTLPAFESLFVKQVGEAMLRAIEWAVVEGDGYGQPTGILANTAPTGQGIIVAEGTALSYAKLVECEAAIPAEYEGAAKWCMTKKTFMSFVGMVDSNGQPIARVNYGIDGKPERSLLGRDVVIYIPQSGSKLKNWTASVDADTLIAFICDFGDYTLNTNYNLGISHARDWDNEDHKTKAVLACDGKMIRTDSLVTLTIDAA